MFNFFHIAKNTFRECLREPIFFVLLLTALVLIGHFPSLSLFVFHEQLKMVVDSSMATTMVFSLFAAVLCAAHTITREMRNGTVLLLFSKPVHRWSFIFAKIIGIIAALFIFVFICNIATLVSVFIAKDQFLMDMSAYYLYFSIIGVCALIGMVGNFMYGKSFSSNTVFSMLVTLPLFLIYLLFTREKANDLNFTDLVLALTLLFFAGSAMTTITVIFSTRLDIVANLVICTVIFFLGLVSSYLFERNFDSWTADFLAGICYVLLPNWQFFWMADALAGQEHIPVAYVLWSGLYVLLYMAFCCTWAALLFQNREIARDSR